jgi:SAM-dependent methyltransferase
MTSAIEPGIVLAAYAEPVVNGRRVLFIGPALSALPERLLERGARLVHVCDPEPVRLAEATAKNRSPNISFSALADGHFALRDGAFDVCLVEDAGITDPVALMPRIRRALTPRGVAILASFNREAKLPLLPHRQSGVIALDYYALYDAVREQFEHVRMLGQAPFVGYVVADFAPEGAPEPSLDTAFLPGGAEEPELFIAVASQHPVELEPFAVIQLPYRSALNQASSDDPARDRSRAAEQASRGKLQQLEAAEQASRGKLQQLEAAEQASRGKLQQLEAAEQASRGKLQQLEAAEQASRGKLKELEVALEVERKAVVTRDAKLREAETRVFARDAELAALRQELEGKNQQLRSQETSLAALDAKLRQGPAAEEVSAAAAELSALEQALKERGEHVRKLERELREAERVGRELVRQLPKLGSDAAPSLPAAADTEGLAQKLAKSQADLIATRWALEAAVRRAPAAEASKA